MAVLHNSDEDPLNMDLILKLALEHVGKADIADLKTCRLVNHSWNRLAVQVLEKRGYALELDYRKMVDYNSLLFQTQLSQLPTKHNNLTSLRLSLSLFPDKYFRGMSELGKAGQLLVLNSHLRLAFIKCKFVERQPEFQVDDQKKLVQVRTNQELFNLFKLASNSLTNVTIFNDNRQLPHFEEFDFGRYLSLEFPRLVAFVYQAFSSAADDNLLDLTKHVTSVLLRAPTLIKLKLSLHEGSGERTTKSFRALMESCSAQHLQELRVQYGKYTEITQVFCEKKFPNLKMLKMKEGLGIFTKKYNQVLTESCPALTRMEFKWSCTCPSRNVTFECPLLPNILHLSLYPHFATKSTYLESIRHIFSSVISNLSCLQSMSTYLGVLIMLGSHLKESGHLLPPPYLYPVFSTITTLEIEIDFTSDELAEFAEDLEMTALIYHHTFPKLCNLVIKPCKRLLELSTSSHGHLMNAIKHGLFYEAIRFLSNHPGIQCLEIYDQTAGLVDELVKDNQRLQGLKKLTLFEYVPPPPTEDRPKLSTNVLPAYLNLFTTTQQ